MSNTPDGINNFETFLTKSGSREPDKVDLYVGELLRDRRIILGKTQKDIAKDVGITYQQLQKYELGRNRISASRLYALSCILRVPITYFFEHLNQEDTILLNYTNGHGDRDRLELNRMFGQIQDYQVKRGILALMREVLRSESSENKPNNILGDEG